MTVPAVRWVRDALEVGRQGMLLLLSNRVLWVAMPAAVVAAVLLGWVGSNAARSGLAGDEFYGIVAYLVFFQFAFPIGVLYLGVTAIHGDIEARTITFLFSRPLRRSSLLVGRWLGVVAVAVTGAVVALALVWAAVRLPNIAWPRGVEPPAAMLGSFVLAASIGVPAWASVGVAFATWFRRPLVAAAVFVVGWEFVVSMVPPDAGIRTATIADPIRRWLLEDLQPRSGPLREVLLTNLDEFGVTPEELGEPLVALARLTAVALAVALLVYCTREYDSRPAD